MAILQAFEVMAVLLLDAVAKGTVLLVCAWIAVRFSGRFSAAVRHATWTMAMAGLALIPVASATLPTWRLPILPAVGPADPISSLETHEPIEPPLRVLSVERPTQLSERRQPVRDDVSPIEVSPPERVARSATVAEVKDVAAPTVSTLTIRQRTSLTLCCAWSLGVLLSGGTVIVGMWRTIRLRRQTALVTDIEWCEMAEALKQRLQLRRAVEIREHPDAIVPMTWGILNPVVLLPRQARDWNDSTLRAVLLHELAHVRRGDVASQLIGRVVCVLYWFHPLAWYGLRQLRHEREQACDDAVIRSGERASDYAEQLLQVARTCCNSRGLALGVAMAERSNLEHRLESLFDTARSHAPVHRVMAVGLLLVGAITLCIVSSAQPVAGTADAALQIDNNEAPAEPSYERLPDGALRGEAALERMLSLNPHFGPSQNGVQLAAVYSTPQMVFREDDRVPVELFLRNASREPTRLSFLLANFMFPPLLENSRKEQVALSARDVSFRLAPSRVTLEPGEVCMIPGFGIGIGSEQSAPSFEAPTVDNYQLTYRLNVKCLGGDGQDSWSTELQAIPLPLEVTKEDSGECTVRTHGIRRAGVASPERLALLQPQFGAAKHGIQIGVAVSTQQRTFAAGQKIPLDLYYRNVGDKTLTFNTHLDFIAYPPDVRTEDGEPVEVSRIYHWMFIGPTRVTLKPNEVWWIATMGLSLGDEVPGITPVSGKFRLTFSEGIADVNHTTRIAREGTLKGQRVSVPNWSEYLTTGTVDFEIAEREGGLEARIVDSSPEAVDPTDVPPNARPTDDPPQLDAVTALDNVVWWGDEVDGLEPGLWLTATEDPHDMRVPMDSLIEYRVVVRNSTANEIEFLVRLLPFDGQDCPYLIPSDRLDVKGRITAPQPEKKYQAHGAANVLLGINPAYIIKLAPGESVLVPSGHGLFVGKPDSKSRPYIHEFVPGTHWVVQPLQVYVFPDNERVELTRGRADFKVQKVDHNAKTCEALATQVPAIGNSKGEVAYAKYHLEVGTLDAAAHRHAETAIWGEVEQGMQCGIRVLNPKPTYRTGDTLDAELLWRNTSDVVISTARPRRLDLYPSIEDVKGKQQRIHFGARYELYPAGYEFQPGEARSLGVVKVTLVPEGAPAPKDNSEPGRATLKPGKYKLSGHGGVGNIDPRSGQYEFTVAPSRG